jgi:two-component system OmpR family sensor kinase
MTGTRRWSGRLSSRQRLTAQVAAALLLLWSGIGWTVFETVERRVYADVDDEMTAELPQVVGTLELLSDEEMLDITSRPGSTQATALLVVDRDGIALFVPSGTAAQPDPAPDLGGATAASLRGRSGALFTVDAVAGSLRYRIATAQLDDGRVLVRARPLDEAEEILTDIRAIIIVAFISTVLGAAVLVWLISRQALRPLETVIAAAGDISDASLGDRVSVPSTAPDVVRLADALNEMLGRLEESFHRRQQSEERLRQFVADASHELRTPLAAVIGLGELYQQRREHEAAGVSPGEAPDHLVARMLGEADRMKELVEDLLTLARLDERGLAPIQETDLTSLVADALATIQATTTTHRFELSAEHVTVHCDRQAVRSLVDNLLRNVVDHTPEGTSVRVAVRFDDQGDACIEVDDDGPGLEPDELARAFDRFWRAAPDRSRPGGSGLGLAIVAEVARAHGGDATIHSTGAETGLRVTVRIPAPLAQSRPGLEVGKTQQQNGNEERIA